MRLLVISDLHCHASTREPKESFLLAGGLRAPAKRHPLQALLDLLEGSGTTFDAIVCPGDLSDQICPIGFQHAWYALNEISATLNIPVLVSSLGNHDVDSYRLHGRTDPFEIPRSIHPAFPLSDPSLCRQFFDQGAAIVAVPGHGQLIVINSVIDHHDQSSAKRGTFNERRLEELNKILESTVRERIRVAVLHHHVALHSSPIIGDIDVLETGDLLTNLLSQFGVQLVIHGHKHHPRARYVDTPSGQVFVLGAGSFSAYISGDLSTNTRNVFHVLNVDCPASCNDVRGTIETWEWRSGEGWVPATVQSASFPHLSGFGAARSVQAIFDDLKDVTPNPPLWAIEKEAILARAPEVVYLSPNEQIELAGKLSEAGYRIDWEPLRIHRLVGE